MQRASAAAALEVEALTGRLREEQTAHAECSKRLAALAEGTAVGAAAADDGGGDNGSELVATAATEFEDDPCAPSPGVSVGSADTDDSGAPAAVETTDDFFEESFDADDEADEEDHSDGRRRARPTVLAEVQRELRLAEEQLGKVRGAASEQQRQFRVAWVRPPCALCYTFIARAS